MQQQPYVADAYYRNRRQDTSIHAIILTVATLGLVFSVLAFTWAELGWERTGTLISNNGVISTDCDDGNECTVDIKTAHGGCIYQPATIDTTCTTSLGNGSADGTCLNSVCVGGACEGICAITGDCPTASNLNILKADASTTVIGSVTCTTKRCVYQSIELAMPTYALSVVIASDPAAGILLTNYCSDLLIGTPYQEFLVADWVKGTTSATANLYCVWTFGCSRPGL